MTPSLSVSNETLNETRQIKKSTPQTKNSFKLVDMKTQFECDCMTIDYLDNRHRENRLL